MDGLNKFKKEIQIELDKVEDENKRKYFSGMMDNIITHIEDVCDDEYDGLLAQSHKSFTRMWTFVMNKARERAINGCAFVDDPTVYGWIDEYVGLDDKAEIEAEIKEAEERKAKQEKATANKKAKTTAKTTSKTKMVIKKAEPEERQASIFDLF